MKASQPDSRVGLTVRLILVCVASLNLLPWPVHAELNVAEGRPVSDQELLPEKKLRSLRRLGKHLAKLGLEKELEVLCKVLLELGDDPLEHEELVPVWERELTRGIPDDKQSKALGEKLSAVVLSCERTLKQLDSVHQKALARLLLKLDSQAGASRLALDHVMVDGDWLNEADYARFTRRNEISELVQSAFKLQIEVEHGVSTIPPVVAIYGEKGHYVRAHGVELHGGLSAAALERILLQSLRASSLSNALLGGRLEPKELKRPIRLVMLSEIGHYDIALQMATELGKVSASDMRLQEDLELGGYGDSRGWRVCRWALESRQSAQLLWRILKDNFHPGVQPCLLAGHLQWLCATVFGTSMSAVVWRDVRSSRIRSTDNRELKKDALWQSAATSIFASREWIRRSLNNGHNVLYSRSIVDKLGKISGAVLLKATLMNEFFQERGELNHLLEVTTGRRDRVEAMLEALGRDFYELEKEWMKWLNGEPIDPGLVQLVTPKVAEPIVVDPQADLLLEKLIELRTQAFDFLDQDAEQPVLFPVLSEQAARHARYLELNPDQNEVWPDEHEEYSDREGFSSEGSWAGLHSVIGYKARSLDSLNAWMGTFYHRLPLLVPGLFGVGYGESRKTTVFDVTSLVAPYWRDAWVIWPPRDAKGVPLRFTPEQPNPVPGESQSSWGYPITLQVYRGPDKGALDLTMELFKGKSFDSPEVPCFFLTPDDPHNPKLAPEDTYGLIPKKKLARGTVYTVRARSKPLFKTVVWSFKTGS